MMMMKTKHSGTSVILWRRKTLPLLGVGLRLEVGVAAKGKEMEVETRKGWTRRR
jgi:hypothetical protein